MNRIDDCLRLLALLEGCPQGAPEKLLMIVHSIPPAAIYQCVSEGLIRAETQMLSHRRSDKSFAVFRFHITERGRAFKTRP